MSIFSKLDNLNEYDRGRVCISIVDNLRGCFGGFRLNETVSKELFFKFVEENVKGVNKMDIDQAIEILKIEKGVAELDFSNGDYNMNTIKFINACQIVIDNIGLSFQED